MHACSCLPFLRGKRPMRWHYSLTLLCGSFRHEPVACPFLCAMQLRAAPACHHYCRDLQPNVGFVPRKPHFTQPRSVPLRYQTDAAERASSPANMTKYNGYAAVAPHKPLERYDYELPELGPNEVDIAVSHNGVCHTDIHMRDDDWGISKFPFIPGHEVVGTVAAKGTSVTTLQVGQRVGFGWIKDSCRGCSNCIRGLENLCLKGYTGTIVMGNNGGFQPMMRAPADFCYPIPDALDSASAAPLLCAGITVYAPLRAYVTEPGMKVAVIGVGGLGHLAVQFAAAMGAVVTGIDVQPDKKEEVTRLGASEYLLFKDALESRKAHFDLILNSASASLDWAGIVGCLAPNGTLVQLGIPGGNALIQVPLQDVVFGQRKVAGSIVGGRADMMSMLEFAAAKGIKPMVEIMRLDQVNEAFDRVQSGKARYRVVLETQQA